MKKILSILSIFTLSILTMTSCKKDSKGVSFITTYADMELEGPSTLFWQLNEPYVDPGCTAMEGDINLTDQITVKSNVNTAKGGVYTVTYSVNNSDGFPASVSRTVVVCDKNAPLNGYYESRITRDYNGASANRGPYTLLVFGVGGDDYYVQDLLGRWYDVGSGYGAAYAGPGVIRLKGDNTFELISSENLGFSGESAPVFFDESTYDPATKTIKLNTIMGDTPDMFFKVTLSNPSPLFEE